MPKPEKHVFVCLNSRPPGHPKGSCTERGAEELLIELGRLMEVRQAFGKIAITRTGCLGPCELGPTLLVYPDGVMYVISTFAFSSVGFCTRTQVSNDPLSLCPVQPSARYQVVPGSTTPIESCAACLYISGVFQ